jgi:trehalose-phosphatase
MSAVRQRPQDHVCVLLAFDGVLADYQEDPDAVRLAESRRELLRRLAHAPAVAAGIISGRRVADLEWRIGLGDELFYIGMHGLEAAGPAGFTYCPGVNPDDYCADLRQLAFALEQSIGEVKGARLENKDGVLALHTRGAASSDAVWCRLHLLNQAAHLVSTGRFRIVRGSHVFALVPNAGPTRAAAIAAVRRFLEARHRRRVFIVYVGEHVMDDDAHAALSVDAVAAFVGTGDAEGGPSRGEGEQLMAQLAVRADMAAEPEFPSASGV